MIKLLRRNKHILKTYIKKYEGEEINGHIVTEFGLLAGTHLRGRGTSIVKKYLYSNSSIDLNNVYGTNVSKYINKFSNYNISHLKPLKKSKIWMN